jgi:hypothetical protein
VVLGLAWPTREDETGAQEEDCQTGEEDGGKAGMEISVSTQPTKHTLYNYT